MSKSQGGVVTPSYKCLNIHIIGDSQAQCNDRLDTLNQMIKVGDIEFPNWARVERNHGGGGGP